MLHNEGISFNIRMNAKQQNEESNENGTNAVSPESILYARARKRVINAIAKKLVATVEPKTGPLVQEVQDQLPKETEEVRNLPFYNATLQALQYQRDQYLMGTNYAQEKVRSTKDAQQQQQQGSDLIDVETSSRSFSSNKLSSSNPLNAPYDPTSLASQQLIPLGASFLPSPTVHQALLPIVVSLPSGALREPILNATINSIPMGQPALNDAVKNSMIRFLSNPHWKKMVQNQTHNTLIGSHHD